MNIPQPFVKALSAVQVVASVICAQGVVLAVEREFTACDAVAKAADECADELVLHFIAVHIVVAQCNINHLSAAIGYQNRLDGAAEVQNTDRDHAV